MIEFLQILDNLKWSTWLYILIALAIVCTTLIEMSKNANSKFIDIKDKNKHEG